MLNLLNGNTNDVEVPLPNVQVCISNPTSFSNAEDVAGYIKKGIIVAINTEHLDNNDIQRLIDYLSGVVFALDGKIEKASSNSYVITPHFVKMENSLTLDF